MVLDYSGESSSHSEDLEDKSFLSLYCLPAMLESVSCKPGSEISPDIGSIDFDLSSGFYVLFCFLVQARFLVNQVHDMPPLLLCYLNGCFYLII